MSSTSGIDIGSEAIKGVVLNCVKEGGPVEVLAAGALPIGELGHMEDSTDKTLAFGVKLKELVKKARLQAANRRVAVSGNATSIKYLQVPPVPPWRLDMLVKYEVEERSSDKEATTYDYHILDVPEVAGQYSVLIGACKESAALNLLSIAKAGGLGEVEIDLEALALYNAYYHGHGFDSDKTVLVVDIGADDVTVLLCRNGALYFARTIMGGGRRFTQVLADELKIDPIEAEELKKTHGEITFDMGPVTGRTARIPRPGIGGTTLISRNASGASARPVSPSRGSETALIPSPVPSSAPDATALIGITGPAEPSKGDDQPKGDITLMADKIVAEKQKEKEILQWRATEAETIASPVMQPANADGTPVLDSFEMPASLDAIDASLPTATAMMNAAVSVSATDMDKRKRQMSGAFVREAASLCAALENSVLFCKQQTKLRELKIDRVYITGGTSKLKGLLEFMNRRMRLEVVPLEPFKQISLARLSPEQAAGLIAEQHTMAVAAGLALSDLKKGAFSFLLWPQVLKEKKIFWSRGAYTYYAAALAALALVLFLWTPLRNSRALAGNLERADAGMKIAQTEKSKLLKLIDENRQKELALKQITENTLSGDYFIRILAELKNSKRIGDDIYITQISTNIPEILHVTGDTPTAAPVSGGSTRGPAAGGDAELDTFQAQRRVYLRGFVRSKQKEDLISRVSAFDQRLLPDRNNPDNPANLFKDIIIRFVDPHEIKRSEYFLKEFVCEAFTEGTRDTGKKTVKPPTSTVLQTLPDPKVTVESTSVPANSNPDLQLPPQPVEAVPAIKTLPPQNPALMKKKFVLPTNSPGPAETPKPGN